MTKKRSCQRSCPRVETALAALALVALSAAQTPTAASARSARDWPQWRGPDLDGISKESNWVVEGKEDSLWSKNVGIGYSTVSIAGGRLYTMGHDKEAQEDTVFCVDARTGEAKWRHSFPAKTLAKYHIGGTCTTPSIDGDRVYVTNRWGRFFCFDAESGKVRWSKDLKKEHGLQVPTWGLAASPLILDDKVVINMGKVLAFKKNGKLAWKTKDYGHAYSTPAVTKAGNKPALAVFNGDGLVLIDQKNGKALTKTFPWKTKYDVNAATPVPIGDKLFISSGYNRGAAMVQRKGKDLEKLWESKIMRTQLSGAVLYEDHLYGFDEATLKCIDLDGNEKWSKRGLGKGALVLAGGRIVALSARGDLVIAEATPEEFKGLSRTKVVPGGVCWTTPVVLDGLIYCRNSLGDLVCRDHRGESK